MFKKFLLFSCATIFLSLPVFSQQTVKAPLSKKTTSGNPIFPGWYADPEGVIFKNKYWIYPTY
ncbi:MAG: arabinan endo-1,5-alpha-L-arabinosidase, partial [Bacteroidota bacterium]|nr:arabinan endo-1,5-alpha-L-arabinosidase [Bacteroidota bacterium]